jgi:hypothetical protein
MKIHAIQVPLSLQTAQLLVEATLKATVGFRIPSTRLERNGCAGPSPALRH